MTALRQRLIEDMQLRNFSPHTIEAYVRAVAHFSKRYGKSPGELTGEQVRQHLLWLVKERRVSWSLYNQSRCALQFFFRVTLGRDEWFDKLPCAKRPKRLPTVLSPEELRRLFDVAAHEPKHQALMMVLYGAGLRISEALALKPADIDSGRMLIHVRDGKGYKARMVKLSPQLLAALRSTSPGSTLDIDIFEWAWNRDMRGLTTICCYDMQGSVNGTARARGAGEMRETERRAGREDGTHNTLM